LNDEHVVPDARCERLSAALARPCLFAEHGCKFEGNRVAVHNHEKLCESVPRSVLRDKIKKWKRRYMDIEQGWGQETEAYGQLISRQSHLQSRIMKCALGPDPALNAIRTLYNISLDEFIAQVKRQDVIDEMDTLFSYRLPQLQLYHAVFHCLIHMYRYPQLSVACRIVESNHNVALLFRREDDNGAPARLTFAPGQRLTLRLLHPLDETMERVVSFDLTKLNTSREEGFPNFLTSSQLNEFCVHGIYFIAA
jgi:hypothetical protein